MTNMRKRGCSNRRSSSAGGMRSKRGRHEAETKRGWKGKEDRAYDE
jgi:hypothetical protein